MSFRNTAEAVAAWAEGWALSRGAAEPVSCSWGFTIDVGLPQHVMRHVLTTADEPTVRKITEDATAPGAWLKAFVASETLTPWLAPGWSLAGGPGFLMAAPLRASGAGAPGGYRTRTWNRAGVPAPWCAPRTAPSPRAVRSPSPAPPQWSTRSKPTRPTNGAAWGAW